MAPRDRNPLDPDRIDISLELVGEGHLRAVEALTAQLSSTAALLNNVGSLIPEQQLRGAQTVAGSFNQGLGVHEGPSPYRSTPPTAGAQDAAGLGASHTGNLHELTNLSFRQRLGRYRQEPGGVGGMGRLIDREINVYGGREAEQARNRAGMTVRSDFAEPSALHAGTQFDRDIMYTPGGGMSGAPSNTHGGASQGASMPRPAWMQALQANPAQWERAQEGFVLPQFGELTIQDKLRMGSDFFTRSATRAHERAWIENQRANQPYNAAMAEAMSLGFSQSEFAQHIAPGEGLAYTPFQGAGLQRGRAANLLRMGADQSAQIVTAMNEIRRMTSWGSGMQAQGIAAGFERGGTINIPGTEIGIQNPLDMLQSGSAMREAINQRVNVQRLRLRGGITGGQASEIIGSLAGLGWTGEEGQNLAFDTVAPLVQQGQNPGIVSAALDQAIRNGNTSLEDFRTTMDDLGPSARAARMSLDEYQQGLMEFAEVAQEMGAFAGQGQRLGRNLSEGFGITPQQSASVIQSPLTQGLAMMNYGVLPNELGALGAGAIGNATGQSIDMAMRAAGAFNQDIVRDGKVVMTGEERQSIQAAQFMGVSRETFERLRRGRDITPRIFEAQEALEDYSAGTKNLKKADGGASIVTGAIKPGEWVPTRKGQPGAEHFGGNIYGKRATVAGYGEKIDIAAGAGALSGQINDRWETVESQLRAMAPKSGKERKNFLKSVDALDDLDPAEKASKARKMLNKAAQDIVDPEENKSTVKVRFTGAAAKYFEQIERDNGKPKKDSDRGGKPVRETAASHATETDYIELLRAQSGAYGG
jgi:hypothetical protein